MCGIAAIFGEQFRNISGHIPKGIFNEILYRGTDGNNSWSDNENIVLYHSRLSIIDLDTGAQPMSDISERFWIIFNGEVYNYLELRKTFENQGSKFRTHSDTEVILEGYKLKGSAILNDLNGMFAFVLYDSLKKEVLVARDRLGKKPIYYYQYNNLLYFSSTINSFKHIQGFQEKICEYYLYEANRFGSSISNRTIWDKVFSVPPASFAFIKASEADKKINFNKYWSLTFHESSINFNDAISEYSSILKDSIKIRLRSDVPISLTFSGGVDSGTIAAITKIDLNTELKLFCIDYDEEGERSSELSQAQDVANYLGIDLNFINYNYRNIFVDLEGYYKVYDNPCFQLPLVYSTILYQKINSYGSTKVTLSGIGADELFTGYNGDEKLLNKDKIFGIFAGARKLPFIGNNFNVIHRMIRNYKDYEYDIINAFKQDLLSANITKPSHLNMYMCINHRMRDANFVVPDISGYASNVEVRSPYLDYRMIEFAASLPVKYKIHNKTAKYLPKVVYSKYVPDRLAFSSKKGMGYNLNWHKNLAFHSPTKELIYSILNNLTNNGIDSRKYLQAFNNYIQDMHNGIDFPQSATTMMFGIMLGVWLKKSSVK